MSKLQPVVVVAYALCVAALVYMGAYMLLAAGPANAADGGAIGIAAEMRPYLNEAISVLIAALIAWVATTVKRRFGIDIQAKHRDALHTALSTGSMLAIDRKLTGAEARALVLDYLQRSVPDALRALAPGGGVLADLVDARLAWLRAEMSKAG